MVSVVSSPAGAVDVEVERRVHVGRLLHDERAGEPGVGERDRRAIRVDGDGAVRRRATVLNSAFATR